MAKSKVEQPSLTKEIDAKLTEIDQSIQDFTDAIKDLKKQKSQLQKAKKSVLSALGLDTEAAEAAEEISSFDNVYDDTKPEPDPAK